MVGHTTALALSHVTSYRIPHLTLLNHPSLTSAHHHPSVPAQLIHVQPPQILLGASQRARRVVDARLFEHGAERFDARHFLFDARGRAQVGDTVGARERVAGAAASARDNTNTKYREVTRRQCLKRCCQHFDSSHSPFDQTVK